MPMHSHPHEQVGTVRSGKVRFCIGDEERIVEPGDFFSVPSDVPHSAACISDEPAELVEIFCPVREDFIKKLKKS